MIMFFLVFSVSFSILSYMMTDPMKSCFSLILSILFVVPLISLFGHVWYSYFISLLFLSGVFLILVYFSSLSSLKILNPFLWIFCFMFLILSGGFFYWTDWSSVNLSVFYFKVYLVLMFYLLSMLIYLMNFVSYFLSFSGALRKF